MSRAILVALAATTLLASGCGQKDELRPLDLAIRDHVLSRTGYGPDAWTRQRIQELGIRDYIVEQLDPASIDDSAYLATEIAYPRLSMTYREIHQITDARPVREELAHAKVRRAIESRRQLEAVLIDFWFDHFSVFADEGLAYYDIAPYERQAIAPHVLGRFEDMLVAVAHSPSMLDYLDNDESSRWGLNENYSRELMELHTLGVDGGYTEADVIEVARALTGWTTDYDASVSETGFIYDEWNHDQDPKTVLGVAITSGGQQDGLDVLHLLATHPSTAAHLARKLAARFVDEDPPQALVNRVTQVFLDTEGDLHQVMSTLLLSPEFLLTPDRQRAKVKRPLVFMASLARALEAGGAEMVPSITYMLEDLGEALYLAHPPVGYPDSSAYWTGNGTLLARFEFLYWTAHGYLDLEFTLDEAGSPAELAEALIARVFLGPVSDHTRTTAVAYLEGLPAYVQQNNGAPEILAMLLSSPEFLQH